jgi:hypothetical protein
MAEVVNDLVNQKHDVHVVNCGNKLSNCYFNQTHNIIACAICQSRANHLLSMTNVKSDQIQELNFQNNNVEDSIPEFDSLQSLMSYQYKGINIGRGVASTIISIKRDYEISSNDHGQLIKEEMIKAMNVLEYFEAYIEKMKPEKIYLFNGRFSECFPLLELAKKYEIPFAALEAGSNPEKYMVFENSLPHSIENFDKRANLFWDSMDATTKENLSNQWFQSKRAGLQKNDKSYIGNQVSKELPDNFDKSKMNITIFNSSEDEMKAIAEWKSEIFSSQNVAIEMILNHFKDNDSIHFFLRVHPNLLTVRNRQIIEIKKMSFPNLTVIDSSSKVDSYHLMEVSDKVICFGSTVGVEATYWGTPSILFGKSFYMYMDAIYAPSTFQDLAKLIEDKDLQPKAKSNTLKYGLYVSEFGFMPKAYEFGGKFNSKFKGKKIKRVYWDTIFYLVKYIFNIKKWISMQKIVHGTPLRLKHFFKL